MITEAIKLGSGNLFLDVAGNVTQTTTGTITAAGLALMVDGNTMLGLGNNVATLAANTGGTIFYNDSDGLTVGTVSENASPATMMIPGITTTNNDDVKLIVGDTATEHLMITEAIKLGSGNLFLDVAGNVTQTTTGTITAAGLALMVDGNTMLGLGNNVATLAANTGGTIFYNDSDGLTVGTVSENASPATMMIPGITTPNNDDVKLVVGEHLMITEGDQAGQRQPVPRRGGQRHPDHDRHDHGGRTGADGRRQHHAGTGQQRRYAGRQHRWHDFLQRQRRLDGGHGQRECLAGDDDDPGHHHHK